MGDNVNLGNYMGGSCVGVINTDYRTSSQALCVFVDGEGHNFMSSKSLSTNTDFRETCTINTECDSYQDRRWEIWIR